jgi:hypothetical protein
MNDDPLWLRVAIVAMLYLAGISVISMGAATLRVYLAD